MSVVLDSGALVAIERGDRRLLALLRAEREEDRSARTHGGVIGQVWRGGTGRQTILARILPGVQVVPLDDELGRRAGVLIGETGGSDVIDAALVLLAEDGDDIYTGDASDLAPFVRAARKHISLHTV